MCILRMYYRFFCSVFLFLFCACHIGSLLPANHSATIKIERAAQKTFQRYTSMWCACLLHDLSFSCLRAPSLPVSWNITDLLHALSKLQLWGQFSYFELRCWIFVNSLWSQSHLVCVHAARFCCFPLLIRESPNNITIWTFDESINQPIN